MHFEDLPPEILVYILSYLPTHSLLNLSETSKYFNEIINSEIHAGKFPVSLKLDQHYLLQNDDINIYIQKFPNLKSLKLINFEKPQDVLKEVNPYHNDLAISINLRLEHCYIGDLNLLGLPFALNGIHFDQARLPCTVKEDHIPTQMYHDLASLPIKGNLTSLTLPKVPQLFIPLILTHQENITELEVGICSNQIIAIICQVLKYLRKFSFCGSDLTHPGVMSILERKSTLQQLCIQSPRYLTKYSMKLLSEEMSLLRTLKLIWRGKLLINNPWNFDYNLDREEQRVDIIFTEGNLIHLSTLELSGFYQTVDNNTIQELCYKHLSSNSDTINHLQKVSLAHCYKVNDIGVQWLVGSFHSPKIKEMNLSNTELTGNTFHRMMPSLHSLILDCCSSLNGQGLYSIAKSCLNLKILSISMNKQLTDEDLNLAFKSADISRNIPGTGFSGLESFEANYININGSCFKNFRAYGLKKLCLHSCPKIKDHTGIDTFISKAAHCLQFLDLSASGITGSLFSKTPTINFSSLKTLHLEFCQSVTEIIDLNQCPDLKILSTYASDISVNSSSNGNMSKVNVINSGSDSEIKMKEYAAKRGLRLTNWAMTQKYMVKPQLPMLSQIRLTSLEDR